MMGKDQGFPVQWDQVADQYKVCFSKVGLPQPYLLLQKGKRKVQGMPQSQTAALPRHQEEEETDKSKQHKSNKRTKSTKISSLFPKRGNRNAKRTEKHKNKITQGKT